MNRRWSSLATTGVVCAASSLLALGCGCHVDTTGTTGDSGDGGGGGDATMGTDGDVVGTDSAVPLDAGPNDPPVLVLDMPPGMIVAGNVPYGYTLVDADGDVCSISVTYATGAMPAAATSGPGGDGTTGLAATPGGVAHTWFWDSAADLPGDVDGVDVCFTPNDGTVDGATVCAPAANVRNTTVPTDGIKINEVGVGIPDYVEVINNGTVAVDLSAWQVLWVSGNGTSGAMVVPPLVMMPGDVVELREGMGLDTPTVVHIGSNAEWDEALGGSVDLVDAALAGVDFVRWGGDASTPSAPGAWTEAAPLPVPQNNTEGLSRTGALDTDDAADFCVTGASPGAPNPPCPPPPVAIAAGDILITEVDTGDTGIADTIELYNVSAADINLSGAILRVEDEGFVTAFTLPGFLLAAGARVLIADNAGTPGPDTIVLGDNINWSGATFSMSVGLEDGFGGGVDFVGFGGSMETPAPPVTWTGAVPVVGAGGSASRVPDATDTDSAADWCVSLDTPLAANSCQLTAADVSLVINELNTSIPDWIEIANLGATDVDLSGWSLEFTPGGFGGPDVFPITGSAVVPAGGFLVIADGDPGAPFFDTGFFNIAWGPAPAAGSLALRDPAGTGEDFVRFGGDPTAPPPGTGWTEAGPLPGLADAEFLNRTITAGGTPSDTDDAADWCVHTTSTIGAANTTCP